MQAGPDNSSAGRRNSPASAAAKKARLCSSPRKDADADLPQRLAAKKEYATL
jgi:hypothetical protein